MPAMKIPAFIGLLIGLVVAVTMVPVINTALAPLTTIYSVSNESLGNITVPQVVQTSNYPVVENSETIRLTNTTDTVTLVRDTHYSVISYPEGKFNITSTADLTGTITGEIDYQWHSPNYIESPAQRTMLYLIPLLVMVGIVAYTVRTAL